MAVRHREHDVVDAAWTGAEWPEVDPGAIAVSYEKWPLDTLYVEFFGAPRPGVYVTVEPGERPTSGLLVKVAEDGSTVVGVMVQAYLAWAESRWPFWLDLAPLAGITEAMLDAFGLTPPETTDRDRVIGAFLADVRAAWGELGMKAITEEPSG